MNKTLKASIFISTLFFSIILIQSCSKETTGSTENDGNGESSSVASTSGTSKSHNMGLNCMNCHKAGGPGEGIFTAAGTVYNSAATATFPNATINFYTGPNGTGTLLYTVSGDNLGNFYTSQALNFAVGLYPTVQGKTTTMYMSTSISTGQCNSCHGVSTGKIVAL
jgi:hypothetical protein